MALAKTSTRMAISTGEALATHEATFPLRLSRRLANMCTQLHIISIRDTSARVVVTKVDTGLLDGPHRNSHNVAEELSPNDLSIGEYRSLIDREKFIEMIEDIIREPIKHPDAIK